MRPMFCATHVFFLRGGRLGSGLGVGMGVGVRGGSLTGASCEACRSDDRPDMSEGLCLMPRLRLELTGHFGLALVVASSS